MDDRASLSRRDRIVDEAARLFATKGYRATSIADIQLACGLTGGSGALYKHFASKRAVLAAVIGTHVATMRAGAREFAIEAPDDLEAALRLAVTAVWDGMHRDRHALRVMLRDLDDFPDLLALIWAEVRTNVYDQFAAWLRREIAHRRVQVEDPDATAAVLLASLTYVPVLNALIGHTPGDLEPDRYADAWVAGALAALRP